MIKGLDDQVKGLKNEIFRLCWYMRGGITIDEAFGLGYEERVIIAEIVKDNLETTKKTGMAFF